MKLALLGVVAFGMFGMFGMSVSGMAETLSPSRVSRAMLAAAGRDAKVGSVDFGESHCDSEVTFGAWLKTLVGQDARAIAWTGGPCRLVIPGSGIDDGSSPWCAQATITLLHPRARDDQPVIELYFEDPVQGHLGPPFAFRSIMVTRDNGPDYQRERRYFEADWRERFPAKIAACQDSSDE